MCLLRMPLLVGCPGEREGDAPSPISDGLLWLPPWLLTSDPRAESNEGWAEAVGFVFFEAGGIISAIKLLRASPEFVLFL